jgi:hypothetical protein
VTDPRPGAGDDLDADAHWVRWHAPYEDPDSPLSLRLRLVQSALRAALDAAPPGPIAVVSLCAGQGRDVIDVVAEHARAQDVAAALVELTPELVDFARRRSDEAGVAAQVSVVEGDAARCAHYAGSVPARVILICGVFGNISDDDISATVAAVPGFCAPGARVIWTRHRRPPDGTTRIRAAFGAAGFDEVSFEAPPSPYVLAVGHHRLVADPPASEHPSAFDPDRVLFTFRGDGGRPA